MLGDRVILQHDDVWYTNMSILFAKGRLFEFWPHVMHSDEEKVNAIVRFSMYATLMLYLANRKPKYLVMGVVAIAIVSYAHHHASMTNRKGDATVPKVQMRPRRQPSEKNPFGNALVMEDDPIKGIDPLPDDPKTEELRDIAARKGLFMEFEDAWNKYSSERQFYTVPENDQGAFAQYLYGDMDKSQHLRLSKTSHW